ncbi:anaphase-promoting complex subunit 1 isoform X2 [Cylas formicarius]|uniref:anaphase-promoting complex subunit 1 isoform X2 n=1 Tax=Cylas formicarius TaxID=197179 RepID=UPI002958DB6B|nr:anaphase-promoting complex subunit 1 isoform X2 [Cylas formicarius]
MIAASDPQEFIPRGRQQVQRHPGPLGTAFGGKNLDELLPNELKKVSISEGTKNESWILRRVLDDGLINSQSLDEVPNNKSCMQHEVNKTGATQYSEFFEDSASFKFVEGSGQPKMGKRLSDASPKFPNKRFSGASDLKATSSKASVDTNRSHCNLNLESSKFETKLKPGYMEDELYINGYTAVWSRGLLDGSSLSDNGRRVIACYTVPLPIRQALWCTFYCERPVFDLNLLDLHANIDTPSGNPVPAICIVDSHNVRVFMVKGEQYVIPVPFKIEKVWNTKFGLFIEKSSDTHFEENYHIQSPATLYSQAYPLDDVCPVIIRQNLTSKPFNNPYLRVVYTHENPSICIMFDANTKEHSVYRIRKVKADERECGENTSHSVAFNTHKLKSRLSMWDNLATPSPISAGSRPHNSAEKICFAQKSRSYSAAGLSRWHSSAISGSPWEIHLPKKETLGRNFLPENECSSKSFFHCSKAMSHLHSSPNICLEHVWTDTFSAQDTLTGGPASKVFLTKDIVGQSYLCYVLPSRFKLSIVKIDYTGPNINFGVSTSISAKDAASISHLRMMAILEHSGNITLYSGLTPVGKLHIGGTLTQHTPSPYMRMIHSPFPRRSSLLPQYAQSEPQFDEHLLSPVLPTPNQQRIARHYAFQDRFDKKSVLVGITDAIENRLTLKYSDGKFYRITLPLLASSGLVEKCLNALNQCLPRDSALSVSCRWYASRNVIGSDDISTRQEWDSFVNLLFEFLGYEDEQASERPETPGGAVKRQKTSPAATDEDWTHILRSNHSKIADDLSQQLNIALANSNDIVPDTSVININPKSMLFPHIRIIHFVFHLLYEDFKLDISQSDNLKPLAILLSKLSNDLGLHHYSIHYWKDFPKDLSVGGSTIDEDLFKSINNWQKLSERPVDVMQHIHYLVRIRHVPPYPCFKEVNNRSKDIVQLCGILSEINRNRPSNVGLGSFIKEVNESVSHASSQHKSVHAEATTVEQVVLMMVEMKLDTKYIETLPAGVAFLIYNALWKCRERPPSDWPVEAYRLVGRDDLVAHAQKVEMEKDKLFQEKMNICFQLQETMPNTKQEIADIDGMEDIDSSLTRMRFSDDVRVMEARKMLASSKPVTINLTQRPDVSDHDFIEEQEKHLYGICIRTMALPVGRGMITLRTATPVITEPLSAPVLCLTGKAPPMGVTVELNHIDTPADMNLWPLFHNGVANGLRITPDAQNIDSTWIVFNKPKGGAEPLMEHAGFLMALGLNGHLKNLEVLSTFDYFGKLTEMTRLGILLGLTAAFRGSCSQFLTKILSIHVEGLQPPTSMEVDVSQNLQVTGLLGIGLLYQGSAHRHITEVLLSEIGRPPGPEMENSVDRESYSLAAGLALGLVMLKYGDQPAGMSDLNVPDTLHYFMVGGVKRPLTGSQKDKYKTPSFQIREGSSVNLDVTAPGATLALGMMYMGTCNKAVADWLAPPDTQYLLDFIRPDFLMLRVLSRCLIMWNDVEASKEWVESQVPSTILPHCMVTPSETSNVDYEAMNQAYCNIVAGACFALGLKYAGSADPDAFKTLLFFSHMFTSLTGKSIAELAGKATIETCLNVLLLSASLVMAGTGNLEVMRLVRHLRRRVGVANSAIVTYGSHLAIHMALGMLFLGGGRYTLSNSPQSVAVLICALYPKFPTHSNDNRYHLQAFRHLYVLAVEPRLVIPRDVDSGDICYVNLRVIKCDGSEATVKAPGLIPDVDTLVKVMVDDERYWRVVFERGRNWDLLVKILSTTDYIEVKQRAGCLSYVADKLGYHSELARTLTHSALVPWDPSASSIVSFSSDYVVKNFCDAILASDPKRCGKSEERLAQTLTRVTYEAVVKDKLMIVPIFGNLVKTVKDFERDPNPMGLRQLKIILDEVLRKGNRSSLLSKETVLSLKQQVVRVLDGWEDSLKDKLTGFVSRGNFASDNPSALAAYVVFYDIPYDMRVDREDQLDVLLRLREDYVLGETIAKILKVFRAGSATKP